MIVLDSLSKSQIETCLPWTIFVQEPQVFGQSLLDRVRTTHAWVLVCQCQTEHHYRAAIQEYQLVVEWTSNASLTCLMHSTIVQVVQQSRRNKFECNHGIQAGASRFRFLLHNCENDAGFQVCWYLTFSSWIYEPESGHSLNWDLDHIPAIRWKEVCGRTHTSWPWAHEGKQLFQERFKDKRLIGGQRTWSRYVWGRWVPTLAALLIACLALNTCCRK